MHSLPESILNQLLTGDIAYTEVGPAAIKVVDPIVVGKLVRSYRHKNGLSNTVHVKMVAFKQGRNYTQSCTYAYIGKSDLRIGEVDKVFPDGNLSFKKYMIEEGALDLTIDRDMKKYVAYVLSSQFLNCPFPKAKVGKNPSYFIEDPTEVANEINERTEYLVQAVSRVDKMSNEELLSAARYFGLISGNNLAIPAILKSSLMVEAQKEPRIFLVTLRAKDRKLTTSVKTAIDLQIFDYANGEFLYRSLPLGRNEAEIMVTLSANSTKQRELDDDILSRDTEMRRMRELDKQQISSKTTVDDVNDVVNNDFEDNFPEIGKTYTSPEQEFLKTKDTFSYQDAASQAADTPKNVDDYSSQDDTELFSASK